MNRSRTPVLACSVVGAAVVALDGTVLTVAQPALQRDLHADVGQVQWTSTGYLVAVASLLVFAGRLGDRHGHRRTFAVGALGFALASAGVALAPGIGAVIALRVLQGCAGPCSSPPPSACCARPSRPTGSRPRSPSAPPSSVSRPPPDRSWAARWSPRTAGAPSSS